MIVGEAGTGKSTTLAAIRDGYEMAGYRVVGMSWTNSVVQDLQDDGFNEAYTIEKGISLYSKNWDRKTVLMVDEAAMLSNSAITGLLEKARDAGAKVILTGDDKQLSSIERGGMFTALKAEHGAAELHTVYRVADPEQKRAYNLMHKGDFAAALNIFDKAGAINWTQTQEEARTALVEKWAADTLAAPDKRRFVFAYSNTDVMALNAELRAVRQSRDELGQDHIFETRDGALAFAVGDRVQFTASAYAKEARASGLVTGGVGTVLNIKDGFMSVELNGKAGKPGRVVTFAVGANEKAGEFNAIRHGYAGTIYKGQGRTLDETYLYHSNGWRSASAYVALSRHRTTTNLFVAREVTRGTEPWMFKQGGLGALDGKT